MFLYEYAQYPYNQYKLTCSRRDENLSNQGYVNMSIHQSGKIVILGWGSLLWEPSDQLKENIGKWEDDGPVLPIEFCRISRSRNSALTLVVDPDNGVPVRTQYTFSKRKNPEDAACDLRTREGTVIKHIGLIDFQNEKYRCHWTSAIDKIKLWAENKKIRAVVWTDLPSNFLDETNIMYSTENAMGYLKKLPEEGQKSAKEYIKNAPDCVVTPLRTALTQDPWFAGQ